MRGKYRDGGEVLYGEQILEVARSFHSLHPYCSHMEKLPIQDISIAGHPCGVGKDNGRFLKVCHEKEDHQKGDHDVVEKDDHGVVHLDACVADRVASSSEVDAGSNECGCPCHGEGVSYDRHGGRDGPIFLCGVYVP